SPVSTGGLRPLTAAGERRRSTADVVAGTETGTSGTLKGMNAHIYTSFPSSGTSTSSPPV
ncbi:MAG: hypothetical protein ACRYF3_04910, partial [Janthinobacterium lividum]